jgi:hypothetical protein
VRLQDRDELVVDTAQPLRLRSRAIELPEQDDVSRRHRQNDEGKAECQPWTDFELTEGELLHSATCPAWWVAHA